MKAHQLLATLAVASLLGQSAGLSLPSLFGLTRRADTKQDADVTDEAEEETPDEPMEKEEPHPAYPHEPTKRPTRPPLVVAIPHPADHLPELPPLPPLPPLPDLHNRETIHATKTVYAVATEKVTIHPVCMKAKANTPPCLPYNPHQPQHHHHHHGWKGEEEGEQAISPSKANDSLRTSAVADLEQPVLLVDGETESGPAELAGTEGERDGRYVELTPALGAAPEHVEIKDEPAEVAGGGGGFSSPLSVVHNLINYHRPVTIYKTKTVWLTKVDKVLDTRVTATVVPYNCVPVNSNIPLCGPPGTYGPGYQYHGPVVLEHGVYTETFGGHYTPGVHGHGKDEQAAKPDADEARELPDDQQIADSN